VTTGFRLCPPGLGVPSPGTITAVFSVIAVPSEGRAVPSALGAYGFDGVVDHGMASRAPGS